MNNEIMKDAKILIIDDNPSNLSIIFEAFDRLGSNILLAQSGPKGLQIAEIEKPDIILLDIVMPHMDGFEVIRRLKGNRDTADIPVIFMTALADMENITKGFEEGGIDYIIKPVEQKELMARISTHLKLKKAENYRLKMEEQIHYMQKLESLGVMAGGIAHDFNNLLMIILANGEALRQNLYEGSEDYEYINNIINTTMRAAKLSEQMFVYSGKAPFTTQNLNLADIIKDMSSVINVALSKNIEVKIDIPNNLPPIEGDRNHITQTIMNLLTNASEAIGEKAGIINISGGTCNGTELTDTSIKLENPSHLYTFLKITDTGCGMDKKTCNRIFDPFFTTKFTGRGLGLSSVFGILKAHRGTIKVESEYGKGSAFTILFPALEVSLCPEENKKQETTEKVSNTILFVDDEILIRTMGEKLLTKKGFNVLTAENGKEALKIYADNQNDILCIFMDIVMPVMDGVEAIKRLRNMGSRTPVFVLSGYNEASVMGKFNNEAIIDGFLQKPFSLKLISEKIEEISGNITNK